MACVVGADASGLIHLGLMLELAAQNFLLLYGLSGLALLKLSRRVFDRLAALLTVGLVLVLMIVQGQSLFYPLGLALAGIVLERLNSGRPILRQTMPAE